MTHPPYAKKSLGVDGDFVLTQTVRNGNVFKRLIKFLLEPKDPNVEAKRGHIRCPKLNTGGLNGGNRIYI